MVRETPVNGVQPFGLQVLIGLREMLAAKKSTVSRQRRWMGCNEHFMFFCVNKFSLHLGGLAPEHEHKVLSTAIECLYDFQGEFLPPLLLVGRR